MEADKINPFKVAVKKLSFLDPQKPIPVILLYCDCVPATFNTCIIIIVKRSHRPGARPTTWNAVMQ